MITPEVSPVGFPITPLAYIRPDDYTADRHVRGVEFCEGRLEIRPDSYGLVSSLLAFTAVGVTLEQAQDWYAGSPMGDDVAWLYQDLGLVRPESRFQSTEQAWRVGRLLVGQQIPPTHQLYQLNRKGGRPAAFAAPRNF